jgi:hypothetical protein
LSTLKDITLENINEQPRIEYRCPNGHELISFLGLVGQATIKQITPNTIQYVKEN